MDMLGYQAVAAIRQQTPVLDAIFQIEQEPHIVVVGCRIDEYRTLLEDGSILLPHETDNGFQQGMSGADKFSVEQPRYVRSFLLESDALIGFQNGIAEADGLFLMTQG